MSVNWENIKTFLSGKLFEAQDAVSGFATRENGIRCHLEMADYPPRIKLNFVFTKSRPKERSYHDTRWGTCYHPTLNEKALVREGMSNMAHALGLRHKRDIMGGEAWEMCFLMSVNYSAFEVKDGG